jgi:predicted short-subunit dehydrogenase-like oxidoreductase (DUF2520 family)
VIQIWVILGRGPLGNALKSRLGDKCIQLASRNWIKDPIDFPSEAKGVFLAVPDDQIVNFANGLLQKNISIPIFHCSGVTPLSSISFYAKSGVWYPMQSFKGKNIPWHDFPVFWEVLDPSMLPVLEQFHIDLNIPKGLIHSSEMRSKYHLAAVFANNFLNHQIGILQEYCSLSGINPSFFDSMIEKSISNAISTKAYNIQTGPAHRGDQVTLERHLEMLPERMQNIYKIISSSIAEIKMREN